MRFVGEYDNLFLSHADRSRVTGDLAWGVSFVRQGASFVDGFLAGAWRTSGLTERATLSIEPRVALAAARDEVIAEGEALLRFLAPVASSPNGRVRGRLASVFGEEVQDQAVRQVALLEQEGVAGAGDHRQFSPCGIACSMAAACSTVKSSWSPSRSRVGMVSALRSVSAWSGSVRHTAASFSKTTGKCSGPSGERRSYALRMKGGRLSGVRCSLSARVWGV